MAEIQLPPIHVPSCYKTSYSCDYDAKSPVAREPVRPSSSSRKHNPQPRHVFLLRRMYNEPVCNVWTPPKHTTPSMSTLNYNQLALTTCAKSSFRNPDGHPNFERIPTRYGSNKMKLTPAKGIVPVVGVLMDTIDEQATEGITLPIITSEPLNMDVKGTKRRLSTSYVLDQHLTEYEAIEDMKARTLASKERYISQSVPRPSRRKLVQTRQPSLSGCSPLVKRKISRSKKSSETSKAQVTSGRHTEQATDPQCLHV